MNENIDLTKILKDCPKGTKFYSAVDGDLYYDGMDISSSASRVYFIDYNCRSIVNGNYIQLEYMRDGKIYHRKGECVLFPSKEQRDWSKFTAPWYKKERFDPKTLKPFDRLLVRTNNDYDWSCDFFSHLGNQKCYTVTYSVCTQTIPYNDETKHLVGTKDEAPEFYRYWED